VTECVYYTLRQDRVPDRWLSSDSLSIHILSLAIDSGYLTDGVNGNMFLACAYFHLHGTVSV
jgi:hypothetical protein